MIKKLNELATFSKQDSDFLYKGSLLKGDPLEYINAEKSSVEFLLPEFDNSSNAFENKFLKEEKLFFYGNEIKLNFHFIFHKNLTEGTRILVFSPLLKAYEKIIKKEKVLIRIFKRLSRFMIRSGLPVQIETSDAPLIQYNTLPLIQKEGFKQEKNSSQSLKKVGPGPPIRTKQSNIRSTFYKNLIIEEEKSEYSFSLILNTLGVNVADPPAEVLWFVIQPAEMHPLRKIGFTLPHELLEKMIFLYAKPSRVLLEINKNNKTKEIVRTIEFARNDRKKIKIVPDLRDKDWESVSYNELKDNLYDLVFDLSKFYKILKKYPDKKVYRNLKFKDMLSNKELKLILPILITSNLFKPKA